MPKITKRLVESVKSQKKDYVVWDSDLPGFGLRVFASGKRSYVIQYRRDGRSRRYTIGLHGIWTAETARREAKVQLGRVAQGDDPAEERHEDRQAMTVQQLCERYVEDLHAGLILGKRGQPKRPSTVSTDIGRINGHIIPLIGKKRVRDLTKVDVTKMMNDIILGKTRATRKTKKLRGKTILRGGQGTATRAVGLLGGILTYASEAGIVDTNVAHGIRKPKDRVREHSARTRLQRNHHCGPPRALEGICNEQVCAYPRQQPRHGRRYRRGLHLRTSDWQPIQTTSLRF
ncbi:Arm DNA-binding domain-containing protein [Pararhodobacter marinus]|uniref:Arm DNA-binding domain-containing protein n=1 Tax=Pararhodobacter marinus TaxID=2184063 RepID=UPI001FE83E4F|nr:Arm DNA-binding domain-containing protein [Pararhodobacter marinus]